MSSSLSPQDWLCSEDSPWNHVHGVSDLAAAQMTQANVSLFL